METGRGAEVENTKGTGAAGCPDLNADEQWSAMSVESEEVKKGEQ